MSSSQATRPGQRPTPSTGLAMPSSASTHRAASFRGRNSSVRIDALGNPYVAGRTFGSVTPRGVPSDAPTSAFLRKYDTNGREQWNTYGSATSSNQIVSLAIAKSGNIYGVGTSDSSAMLVKLGAR